MRHLALPQEIKGIFTRNYPFQKLVIHIMAFEGSKLLSTGSVFFNGNTAWISFAATLPEYRREQALRQHCSSGRGLMKREIRGCKWISVETAEIHPRTMHLLTERHAEIWDSGFYMKIPIYVFESGK